MLKSITIIFTCVLNVASRHFYMVHVDFALRCVSLAADTKVSNHETGVGYGWRRGSQKTGLRQCGQLSGR